MTDIKARLLEAADHLDYLHEGSKHIPTDLVHSEERRGLVMSTETDAHRARQVGQFFWGGAAEVFITLGPAVLPLLANWLHSEADDVAMIDAINSRDPDNPGKTRVLYRPQTSDALRLADHILKTRET